MKKLVAFGLILVLALGLCGCAALIPASYSRVEPYSDQRGDQTENDPDILTASSQEELRQAISSFISSRRKKGVIHVKSYPGDVEEGLTAAAYQAAREDPKGAYAVDFITHSCSLIVSYYEIQVDITYRENIVEEADMVQVVSTAAAQRELENALDRYDQRMVLYLAYFAPLDVERIVEDYCAADPAGMMAQPQVQMSAYPESGQARILDISLIYPHDRKTLREMEQAVADSLNAASVYVRYRDDVQEKAELLYTYLMERFAYTEAVSKTPVYSFLCDGLADSKSAAVSWQLLCDQAGLECVTVSGMRSGSEYWWNIVTLDGVSRHVDICTDLLAGSTLQLLPDSAMADYYWDTARYPACPAPEPEEPEIPGILEPPEEGTDVPSHEGQQPTEPPAEGEEPPAEELPEQPPQEGEDPGESEAPPATEPPEEPTPADPETP